MLGPLRRRGEMGGPGEKNEEMMILSTASI